MVKILCWQDTGIVVDVVDQQFPVANELVWHDGPESVVSYNFKYDNGDWVDISPPPPEPPVEV